MNKLELKSGHRQLTNRKKSRYFQVTHSLLGNIYFDHHPFMSLLTFTSSSVAHDYKKIAPQCNAYHFPNHCQIWASMLIHSKEIKETSIPKYYIQAIK